MALYKLLTFSLMVYGTVGQTVVYCPVTLSNGTQACAISYPSTTVVLDGSEECAGACLRSNCEAFSFDDVYLKCTLYPTPPTFQSGSARSNCNIVYQVRRLTLKFTV